MSLDVTITDYLQSGMLSELRGGLGGLTGSKACAAWLGRQFGSLGLGSVRVDPFSSDACNVTATIPGDATARPIALIARHGCRSEVGALAAMIVAAKAASSGGAIRGRGIVLAAVSGGDGLLRLTQGSGPQPMPDCAITAGTGLGTARPAVTRIVLRIRGKPAWIGNRHMLDNVHAVEKAALAVRTLRDSPETRELRIEFGGLIGGLTEQHVIWRPAMVPDYCSLLLEVDMQDGTSREALCCLVMAALDRLAAQDVDFRFALDDAAEGDPAFGRVPAITPSCRLDESHPLAAACLRRHGEVFGAETAGRASGSAAVLAAAGIDAVSYGPSRDALGASSRDRIDDAPVAGTARVLAHVIADLAA